MKNKLLLALLGLLGFNMTACEKNINGGGIEEYGSPYAEFSVKGNVSGESGDPIKGIRVMVYEDSYSNNMALTDEAGAYVIRDSATSFGDMTLTLVAEDIDGEENGGNFGSETKTVRFRQSDFTDADGWYIGSAEKTVNFTLEKKNSEDESE